MKPNDLCHFDHRVGGRCDSPRASAGRRRARRVRRLAGPTPRSRRRRRAAASQVANRSTTVSPASAAQRVEGREGEPAGVDLEPGHDPAARREVRAQVREHRRLGAGRDEDHHVARQHHHVEGARELDRGNVGQVPGQVRGLGPRRGEQPRRRGRRRPRRRRAEPARSRRDRCRSRHRAPTSARTAMRKSTSPCGSTPAAASCAHSRVVVVGGRPASPTPARRRVTRHACDVPARPAVTRPRSRRS